MIEIVRVVDPDSGTGYHYTSLAAWQAARKRNIVRGQYVTISAPSGTWAAGESVSDQHAVSGLVFEVVDSTHVLFTMGADGVTFTAGDTLTGAGAGAYTATYVSSDTIRETAKCRSTSGGDDTTSVTLADWVTSATSYVTIWCDTAESYRHAGVWDTSKYLLNVASASALIVSACDYLRLDGLQISVNSNSGNYQAPIAISATTASANDIRISNCILKQGGTTSREPVIYITSANTVAKIWNTICYGSGSSTNALSNAIQVTTCSAVDVYNCTLIGGTNGLKRDAGTVTAKNTYGRGTTAGFSGTISTSYCASSTAELGGTGDIDSVAYDTTTFVSVTPATDGTGSYLKPNSAGLLDGAGNAPGGSAPLNYTTDITGATVATWDIGAFDFVEAAAGRATKNTRGYPLGVASGMGFSIGGRA